jgi:hypothetical protein
MHRWLGAEIWQIHETNPTDKDYAARNVFLANPENIVEMFEVKPEEKDQIISELIEKYKKG